MRRPPILNTLGALGITGVYSAGAILDGVLHRDGHRVRRWKEPWCRALARFWDMPVHAFGLERLDPSRTYLYMANHQSHTDIVALMVTLPGPPGFLSKKELRSAPLLGYAMEMAGEVFIDRSNREQAVLAIEEAARQVREDRPVIVFPEGTRGDGRFIRPFKKGGFHLVKQAGVPLVPVGIRGTEHVLPRSSSWVQGGLPVEVHVGVPLPPEQVRALPMETLVERVRSEIARLADKPLA